MPTYEYACRDCGEHLEVVQSFRDAALTTCGRCSGELRKVFSAAGIIFKGSGYYVTDTRSSQRSTSGRPSSKTAHAEGSPASGKRTDAAGSEGSSDAGSAATSSEKATKTA